MSSGFCGGIGPPGLRAEGLGVGVFARAGDNALFWPGDGLAFVMNLGTPLGFVLMVSMGVLEG